MRKLFLSLIATIILILSWAIISTIFHAIVFGLMAFLTWFIHLPVIGTILRFIWSDPRSGNGPAPIMVIFFASGFGGFWSIRFAFEKITIWFSSANVLFMFWSFSILIFPLFVVIPLISYLSNQITFLYLVDAIMLGIGSIAGARTFCKEPRMFTSTTE